MKTMRRSSAVADPPRGWRTLAAGAVPTAPAADPEAARNPWRPFAAVVAGTLVLLLRQGGPGPFDVVYAEDGTVFLAAARDTSVWEAVLDPYAGYAHVVPRVLVEPIASMPLDQAAAALSITACVALSALAVLVHRALGPHIRTRWLRIAAASSFVLLPAGQEEVYQVVANLHWFLVPAAAVLLLWRPTERRDVVLASAVVLLTALSDPVAAVLLPLAALRLLATGWSDRARAIPIALGVGLVVQAAVVVTDDGTREPFDLLADPGRLGTWWLFDVPGRALGGTRWVDDVDARSSWAVAAVAVAALAALTIVAVRRLDRRALATPALLVVQGAALYATYVGLSGTHPPRYGVPAAILLLVAVAIVVDRLRWAGVSTLARRAGTVAGCALLVVIAVNLRLDNSRTTGPSWSDELSRAARRCDGADRLSPVALAVAPGEGWAIRVPCADVP